MAFILGVSLTLGFDELTRRFSKCKDVREKNEVGVLRARGWSTEEIVTACALSGARVRDLVNRFNESGVGGTGDGRKTDKRARLLTPDSAVQVS